MLRSANLDTKKATARGSAGPEPQQSALRAPVVSRLGNQATLRLQRKCDCGGGPDCDCGATSEKKKQYSPKTALHRMAAGAGAIPSDPKPAEGSVHADILVGAVDDPLEREADQVADRVLGEVKAAAPQVQRTERGAGGAAAGGVAPPSVHAVLSSSGGRLDSSTRTFFESRFGRDFSEVRIHTGAQAAESARSVGARAFTVGNNIVFGAGEYTPGDPSGRRLVAHELAHVVQQQQMALPPLRRACKAAADCAKPFPGDPGAFGQKAEAEGAAAVKQSDPDAKPGEEQCTKPHHREKAVNITALTEGEGVVRPDGVSGIFINACFPPSAGAATDACSSFPGGTPDGADADKQCVQVKPETEDVARQIMKTPDRSQWGSERATQMSAGIAHEFQHVRFEAKAKTLVPEDTAKDCKLETIVGSTGHNVEHYLSEMSAEMAQFPFYFQKQQTSPSLWNQELMFDVERTIALNPRESISGIIQGLQCQCECSTVETFITKVFNDAVSSWPADQTDEFKKAMTRMLPTIWPASLQAK